MQFRVSEYLMLVYSLCRKPKLIINTCLTLGILTWPAVSRPLSQGHSYTRPRPCYQDPYQQCNWKSDKLAALWNVDIYVPWNLPFPWLLFSTYDNFPPSMFAYVFYGYSLSRVMWQQNQQCFNWGCQLMQVKLCSCKYVMNVIGGFWRIHVS